MENFFGVVFPKRLKHMFKTASGVRNYLTIKAHNWNEKVTGELKQTGKTSMNYSVLYFYIFNIFLNFVHS